MDREEALRILSDNMSIVSKAHISKLPYLKTWIVDAMIEFAKLQKEKIMPTYDYKCTKCNKIEEKFHGIHDTPSYVCCNSAMKLTFTKAPAVHGADTGGRKSNT